MRIPARLLLGMLLVVMAMLAATPALAQQEEEEGPGVKGRLSADGEPVEGVTIRVFTADGEEVGEATSDENGEWFISLPEAGDYSATLDEDTLPGELGLRDPDKGTLEFDIRSTQRRTLLFPLGEEDRGLPGWVPRVAQASLNGVKFGLIIAMTAIGLSLIFGTTGLVNFAHGELVTFGAVVAFFINVTAGPGSLIWAGVLAVVAGGLLGAVLEGALWRPLRRRRTGLIQMLVISIGLALVLRHLILLWFRGRSRPYLDYAVQQSWELGPVRVTPRDFTVIMLSILVLVGVGLLLERTKIGKAMRAVADNRDLAESSGIDVQRVILFVWILGGALAAMGGLFNGIVENVSWLMGFRLLLLMFAGVILGGIGTAYGALVGSIVVGLVSELSTLYFDTQLKFVWPLLALAIILLFRPQGILGVKERLG